MTEINEADRLVLRSQVVAGLSRLSVLGEPPIRLESIKLRDALPIPRSRNLAFKYFPQNFRVMA